MEKIAQAMSFHYGDEIREDLIVKIPTESEGDQEYDVYVARTPEFLIVAYNFKDGSIIVNTI